MHLARFALVAGAIALACAFYFGVEPASAAGAFSHSSVWADVGLASMMASPAAMQRRGVLALRADLNPATVIGDLQVAWEAFKKEHTAQVEALAKGKADVVVDEKVKRIDASVTELQTAIDDANARIAALSIGGAGNGPVDREYSDAFQAHFRRGEVQASLNKGVATEGGYLAPVEWDRTLTDRLVIVSPMRQIATVQPISTGGFSKLFNGRGTGSGWVGETAVRPETTTPAIGTLNFPMGEIYANPSATQTLLDDSLVNLEQFIADNVETEFAYQEGIAFVAGNGTNKPSGFLTYATGAANAAVHPWGAIQVTTAVGTTAATADELITLSMALPQAYTGNARWVMNRTSLTKARVLKDTTGQYLWQPSLSEGQPQSLLGYPLTEMAAMPNMTTGAIPIAFGDFRRGYLIVDRMGIRVLRDPYSSKPYVLFYTTKRVGGGLNDPDAIKVLKMA